jgi:hypothetical protein
MREAVGRRRGRRWDAADFEIQADGRGMYQAGLSRREKRSKNDQERFSTMSNTREAHFGVMRRARLVEVIRFLLAKRETSCRRSG